MHGLEQEYGAVIDFIHLNIDDSTTLPLRQQFGLTDRSQYALVATAGEVRNRWVGPLNYATVATAIRDLLAEAESR